ncbi:MULTISPECIES: MFS transporter [Bacillus subtilis group]|uniref:MFS transporter n=1 Tax=Bacillus subtilis group TaxID=653685 RepID=UPI002281BB87|nr:MULTISPECIES: MFS transporter [Bacillus subtilis group]MCY8503907.1 MFS transporter [Bacillus inaquosorum]MCY8979235.1 MFS transporter [Bacillus halotolerans]
MNSLFKNRVFLIVQGADLLQQMGIWIRNMALLFYIMEQTNNNPTAVSMLTALEYLPIFVFSLIGGTFADRWEPKKTVVLGDTLSAFSTLLILLLISFGAWQAVFAATVISAIVSQFSQPSSSILLKKHIPSEYVGTAVGINQSLMALFTIFGPVLGAFVYSQLGLKSSIIALFIIFITAAIIQLFLPSYREKKTEKGSAISDIKEGFKYVMGQTNLKLIAAMFLISGVAIGITQPLDVFVIMERLGLPKESVQWFAASEGVGMLIGGTLAAVFSKWIDRHKRIVITSTLISWGIITVVEVLSIWPILTGSARTLSGVTTAFFEVVFSGMMIKEVEAEYIGRTNGIIMPLLMGGMLLGSTSSGFIVNQINLFSAYLIAAILTLSCTILTDRLKLDKKTLAY